VNEYLTNVQRSYEYFDQDTNGLLAFDEVYAALTHAGGLVATLPSNNQLPGPCHAWFTIGLSSRIRLPNM
jgi:hypothetical protein